jgi:hypothetical protein
VERESLTRPRKKALAKQRHAQAIEAYKTWLLINPRAPRKKRYAQFDAYIDSAYLQSLL